MTRPWRLTALIFVGACASAAPTGGPPSTPPSPAPAPTPSIDPGRIEPASPTAYRYPTHGAGLDHYVFVRRDSVLATMPSGEEQVQVTGRTAYVTITWIAADTGAEINASIDSLLADSGTPLSMEQVDSARYARWTAFRPLSGGLTNLNGVEGIPSSLVGDQVRDQLILLFPELPPGGAIPGTSWTAVSESPARVSAFQATEQATIESQAGPVLPSGSVQLQVVRDRSATGEATQFGQAITVHATGSDSLTYSLAPEGRVLSVVGNRVTDLVVELPAIGQSVPAHAASYLQMTVLP
jgi:hypothetical protein